MSAADDAAPISAAEARELFADLVKSPALLLAVSGGSDSTALLILAARWRAARKNGPKLLAVTIDHGLRPQSASEALAVKRLATKLAVPHRTIRWVGRKPSTGLQEAAREARYRLLAEAARKVGARHILTAHTLDDQAETVLIRLARGTGVSGLAAMARASPLPGFRSATSGLVGESWGAGKHEQRELALLRPFLDIPKSRLLATLRAAGVPHHEDPSNRDPRFTRARFRESMAVLGREGLTPERLALLARRVRRADAALEMIVDEAAARLSQGKGGPAGPIRFDCAGFDRLPPEISLRLLRRAIDVVGNEGPVELARLEALHAALTEARRGKTPVRRTLAGAIVTRSSDGLVVERAPARRTSSLP